MAEAMTPANRELRQVLRQSKPKGKSRQKVAPVEWRTYRGVVYDSQGEACFARDLDEGRLPFFRNVTKVVRQPKFQLAEDVRVTPDFLVVADGVSHIVEIKAGKRHKGTFEWIAYWQTAARVRWKWLKKEYRDYIFSVWVLDKDTGRMVKVEG